MHNIKQHFTMKILLRFLLVHRYLINVKEIFKVEYTNSHLIIRKDCHLFIFR